MVYKFVEKRTSNKQKNINNDIIIKNYSKLNINVSS